MDLRTLENQWNELGRVDPMWAVISWPQKAGGKWQAADFFATGRNEVDGLLLRLKSLSRASSGERALDFGCGLGRLSQALAAHFHSVDGVDIAPSMVEQARSYNRYPGRVEYHLNQKDDLALFRSNSFDLIYSSITLQHMAPRYSRAYLREFVRVLRPGGSLVFQLPSHPTWTLKGLLWRFLPLSLCGYLLRLKTGQLVNMEMHGIPRSSVVRLLRNEGAVIIDSSLNSEAGSDWVSYIYTATK